MLFNYTENHAQIVFMKAFGWETMIFIVLCQNISPDVAMNILTCIVTNLADRRILNGLISPALVVLTFCDLSIVNSSDNLLSLIVYNNEQEDKQIGKYLTQYWINFDT